MTTKIKYIDEITNLSIYYKNVDNVISAANCPRYYPCYLTGEGDPSFQCADPGGPNCGYPTSACLSIPDPKKR